MAALLQRLVDHFPKVDLSNQAFNLIYARTIMVRAIIMTMRRRALDVRAKQSMSRKMMNCILHEDIKREKQSVLSTDTGRDTLLQTTERQTNAPRTGFSEIVSRRRRGGGDDG